MSGGRVKEKKEGGGGRESSITAQRFQKPNRTGAPQTHMQGKKKTGFYSFCFGLFPPLRSAVRDLNPPRTFYPRIRSRCAPVLRGRGLRMLCIKWRALHHPGVGSLLMRAARPPLQCSRETWAGCSPPLTQEWGRGAGALWGWQVHGGRRAGAGRGGQGW